MGLPVATDTSPPLTVLNMAAATVVKNGPGFVFAVGTTTGPCTLNDTNIVGGATASNLIATTATATGVTQINFKFNIGLLVTPAGGVASVSFE
jgi:hypothetical protein